MNPNTPATTVQLPGSAPANIDPTKKRSDNCEAKKREYGRQSPCSGCKHCTYSGENPDRPSAKRQRRSVASQDDEASGMSPWEMLQSGAFFERPEVMKTLIGSFDEFEDLLDEDDMAEELKSLTPLHWAASNGYIDILKLLVVEFNMDVNAQSVNGVTPLHMAAKNGHVKAVTLLGTYGVDVESKTTFDERPLHLAAKYGHVEVIKQLLAELGAQINAIGESSYTPLHEAVSKEQVDTVRLLLEFGANKAIQNHEGETPLDLALFYSNIEIVKLLLSGRDTEPDAISKTLVISARKGNVDILKWLLTEGHVHANVQPYFGRTALHAAAEVGHASIARLLITEFHANVNVKDIHGKMPIHLASGGGHVEVVRMLATEFHADKNAPDNNGNTPLHCAAYFGHIEVAKMFVTEYGADIYAKTKDDKTVLHLAATNSKTEVVEWLIAEFGAKLNTKDKFNQTPLHKAAINVWYKSWKIVELLGDCFGDVHLKDVDGKTPLHLASENGNILSVSLLVNKFGVGVNIIDNLGQTSLHLAVKCPEWMREKYIQVVRALVNHVSADINAKDSNNMTPLGLARRNGFVEAVEVFKERSETNRI